MNKKRESTYNILTLIISILLSLSAVEIYLRISKLGYNNAPLNPSSISHHEHPNNFEFNSYSKQKEWNNIIIKFDDFGNRIIKQNCDLDYIDKELHIIFMGDSYVEGLQVNDNNTFTGLIQKKLCKDGIKIHNLGVSGYSPILSYAQLLYQAKNNNKLLISKDSHIIHVLFNNDISEDNSYSKLAKTIKDGEDIITVVDSKKNISVLKRLSRRSYLIRFLRRFQLTILEEFKKDKKTIDDKIKNNKKFTRNDACKIKNDELINTQEYINKIKEFALSKGSKYSLTAIPYDSRRSHEVKRLAKNNYSCFKNIAKNLDLPFIESPNGLFKEPSKYYFNQDIHLNVAGNSLFANEIIRYLKK